MEPLGELRGELRDEDELVTDLILRVSDSASPAITALQLCANAWIWGDGPGENGTYYHIGLQLGDHHGIT